MKIIFIISAPRSGSTLLWKLLSSHPDISGNVTEPFIVYPLLSWLTDDLRTISTVTEKYYNNMAAEFLKSLPHGRKDFDVELEKLVIALHEKSSGNNKYSVDKSPGYVFIADQILSAFPQHKFIFLFRNPLAITASLSSTFENKQFRRIWNRPMLNIGIPKLLRVFSENKSNENIYRLNYEDLVRDPHKSMQALCGFLDLGFEPEMLNDWAQKKVKGMGDIWGEERFKDISVAPVTNWQNFYKTPIRKYWARKYLRFLGRDFLSDAGYAEDDLLNHIRDTPMQLSVLAEDMRNFIWDCNRNAMRRIGDKILRAAGGNLYSKRLR
jgi:hypothetical protein